MNGIKIGIPRALHYYYFSDFWIPFFKELGIEIVESPKTNREILDLGTQYANDEMCLSLKTYIGHVAYLQNKCDYILLPRIDNYGSYEQTCTNFIALYDIIHTLFDVPILDYNIDYKKHQTEEKGILTLSKKLGRKRSEVKRAYQIAKIKQQKIEKKRWIINHNHLKSDKLKILIVAHPYNIYDEYIGSPIITYLKNLNAELIYADQTDSRITIPASTAISETLYWKYSREQLGAIQIMKDKIDGILFFSSFPCGLDSLVNELALRKVNVPHLNIIIDDIDSLTGIETRLESFIDILEQRK